MKLNPPPSFTVFWCKVKGKKEAENLFFSCRCFFGLPFAGCRYGCARICSEPSGAWYLRQHWLGHPYWNPACPFILEGTTQHHLSGKWPKFTIILNKKNYTFKPWRHVVCLWFWALQCCTILVFKTFNISFVFSAMQGIIIWVPHFWDKLNHGHSTLEKIGINLIVFLSFKFMSGPSSLAPLTVSGLMAQVESWYLFPDFGAAEGALPLYPFTDWPQHNKYWPALV